MTKNAGRAILVPPAPSYGISVWYRYDDESYPTLQGKLFNVVFDKMTAPGGDAFGGRWPACGQSTDIRPAANQSDCGQKFPWLD